MTCVSVCVYDVTDVKFKGYNQNCSDENIPPFVLLLADSVCTDLNYV